MSQLLDCSIPIWPTQLGRYTEMARSPDSLQRNYDIDVMQIELPQSEMRGGWTELVHPSGAVYNYNAGMKTFAEMNLRTCSEERLRRLESWVRASRAKLNGKGYLLVVEPIVVQEKEVYPYYYVVPENHIITWVEPVNGYLLFQESMASHWNHKRLELEAQFWKHAEYFPHEITIPLSEVRALRIQLNWYRVEALAIEQSTAASIFWTLDQMKEMTDELIIAGTYLYLHRSTHINIIKLMTDTEELAEPDGTMKGPGVAICGAQNIAYAPYDPVFSYHTSLNQAIKTGHHEYLNHYGQPEARLIRMHSLAEKRRDLEDSPLIAGAAAAMLWIPLMMLRRLKTIYVDGLVNVVDIRSFTDNFSAQAKAQTTVASVIMAVNASILAVPGLGTQLTTKTMCSISFVLSFYCIIGCAIAQHFGHRLRSLDFAVYYLQEKMASLAIIASIPSFLYLTSLGFSILGFLAGVFTAEFGLSLSARIGCVLALVVGAGLILPLTIASFGPGLIR
ncbi:hypothetical protein DEU56DRAFT_920528 [Suillus clintonianus]|uniref:uncharacterized protein n=1 Tax=Suillus clintonianus TaxID=1904413 RepID=UPI001B868AAD|nr:uncharacterized protein DEU56DRAFT_920528 [Suillus clintonianus]KAG2108076.1 hypothetical protein DEU56DRAFT_920528 [Suillus clintonianus]